MDTVEWRGEILDASGSIPNSPLPVLFYRLSDGEGREPVYWENLFHRNGWGGSWRNGVFSFDHYHSTAHEVLGCYRGEAVVRLGGTGGVDRKIQAGEAALLPAGTGHRLIRSSGGFAVVGAYPGGRYPDQIRDDPVELPAAIKRRNAVPVPENDPLLGAEGPARREWKSIGG